MNDMAVTRLVKGTVALVAVVLVAVGVPVALAVAVGWPLPHGVPDVGAAVDTVAGRVPLDPDLLWNVLAVGIWVAWFQLMAALAVEVRAVLAGSVAPRVAGLGAMQHVAGAMVGSIMLLWPSAMPAAASGSLAEAAELMNPTLSVPRVHLVVDDTPAQAVPTEQATQAAPAAGRTHVVERRDTLWSIAERHMAPGGSTEDIAAAVDRLFAANVGQPQPDGAVLVEASVLMPGWELTIPDNTAAETVPVSAPTPEAPRQVVVEVGDTMWDLADSHLGDGHRFGEIMDLNAGQPHVGGYLSDPSVLEPGWVLHLPADTTSTVAAPQVEPAPEPAPDVQSQAAPAEAPVVVEETAELAPAAPPAKAPVEQPEIVPESRPEVAEPTATAEPIPPATVEPSDTDAPVAEESEPTAELGAEAETGRDEVAAGVDDSLVAQPVPASGSVTTLVAPEVADEVVAAEDESEGVVAPVGLLGGGVATAGLLVWVQRSRRARQRHRPSGQRMVELPDPVARTERDLRAGARPDRAGLVDAALRAAAAGVPAGGLEPIDVVVVSDDRVTVWFTNSSSGPAPDGFELVDQLGWRTTANFERLSVLGAQASSPAPALCPIGVTNTGDEVLIDLEASGVLFIDGDPRRVRGLLRSMTVGVATASWATQPQVVLVGLDGEMAALPWVSTASGVRDALEVVTARVERAVGHLGSLGCRSTAQARAVGETPEEWEPTVAISAVEAADLDVPGLDQLIARPGHAGAMVCAGRAPRGVDARQLLVDAHGCVDVGPVRGVAVRHLDAADTRVVVALVDAVRDTPTAEAAEVPVEIRTPITIVDTDPDDNEEDEPGSVLEALLAEVDVVVRVLGDVAVTRHPDGDEVVTGKQKATEAIVYLALREGAVSREGLQAALWPAGTTSTKTFNNVVSAMRTALGEDSDGGRLLPAASGGQYRLSERVVSDYGLFWKLTSIADETEDAEIAATILAEALGLVAGEPFVGAGRGYAWVAPQAGMIVAQVVDAAEELAEVRLATDDWRGAEWAARQGLRAMPCDERMYRLLMRASFAAGNVPGVHRAFRELCDAVADPDLGCEPIDTVHPETLELLADLTGDRASA